MHFYYPLFLDFCLAIHNLHMFKDRSPSRKMFLAIKTKGPSWQIYKSIGCKTAHLMAVF